MKHNERARVAPLYLTFTHPFCTKKMQQTVRWLFLLLLFLLLLLLVLGIAVRCLLEPHGRRLEIGPET
jgi:hypothetical protein